MAELKKDGFIEVPLSTGNLHRYVVRTSILKALTQSLPSLKGELLDAGCGKMPYKEFILNNSAVRIYTGLDIENALTYDDQIRPDFTWDGVVMPFENNTYDTVLATEVMEHCPDIEVFLSEVNRVLKPGGVYFFTVPFLWNLHEVPHDEYRYTPFSLQRHLTNSGFTEIRIKALGGWHASLAQMIGLWVRRAPLRRSLRRIFSFLLMPVVRYLYRIDSRSEITFTNGQMITGLYGTARKV